MCWEKLATQTSKRHIFCFGQSFVNLGLGWSVVLGGRVLLKSQHFRQFMFGVVANVKVACNNLVKLKWAGHSQAKSLAQPYAAQLSPAARDTLRARCLRRAPDPCTSTRTIVVGVCAFSGSLRCSRLVPSKRRYLVPPTSGSRSPLGVDHKSPLLKKLGKSTTGKGCQ